MGRKGERWNKRRGEKERQRDAKEKGGEREKEYIKKLISVQMRGEQREISQTRRTHRQRHRPPASERGKKTTVHRHTGSDTGLLHLLLEDCHVT